MQTQRARECNLPQNISLQAAESKYELKVSGLQSLG